MGYNWFLENNCNEEIINLLKIEIIVEVVVENKYMREKNRFYDKEGEFFGSLSNKEDFFLMNNVEIKKDGVGLMVDV